MSFSPSSIFGPCVKANCSCTAFVAMTPANTYCDHCVHEQSEHAVVGVVVGGAFLDTTNVVVAKYFKSVAKVDQSTSTSASDTGSTSSCGSTDRCLTARLPRGRLLNLFRQATAPNTNETLVDYSSKNGSDSPVFLGSAFTGNKRKHGGEDHDDNDAEI